MYKRQIELFHIYEATPGYTPLLIVASEAGRPFAKLLAAIRKIVRLFPPSIIKRCEIYGTGEYFDETVDKEFVFGGHLHKMKPLDLIILLLTIFLSACQDKQKEIITLLVKEWQGKQIAMSMYMI